MRSDVFRRLARSLPLHGIDHILNILNFIAGFAVIAGALVYIGFEASHINKTVIVKIFRAAQFIFAVSVLFNVAFMPRPKGRYMVVRMVLDGALMLSLIPALIPGGASSAFLGFFFGRAFFICVVTAYAVAEVSSSVMSMMGRRTNPSLMLAASFIVFIMAGSLVLMFPKCHVEELGFIDSLFVATSAVSMTGLASVDISSVFTPLGWTVIAVLMEIGALGVLTFTCFFSLFFAGRPGIYSQLLMRDFIYSKSIGALVPMLLYILGFTLCVEAVGAVAIYFTLPAEMFDSDVSRAGCAAFHAIAAFTNSGFSTIPDGLAYSLIFNGNQLIFVAMAILIIAGGIGFPNLVNFKDAAVQYFIDLKNVILHRKTVARRAHIYDLNTKLVLCTTLALFAVGAIGFFLLERDNALAGMPASKQIIQSIFASVTPRSAGFAPINPAGLMNVTLLGIMFLMWIGGSSQSMAGGIKVNAFAAAMLNLRALVRNKKGVAAFHRRIATESVRRANGTIFLSLLTIVVFTVTLMLLEPALPVKSLIFESLSAVTTNGLSLGVTPVLSNASKALLCAAMFLGRIGLLSIMTGLGHSSRDSSCLYPADDIIIS